MSKKSISSGDVERTRRPHQIIGGGNLLQIREPVKKQRKRDDKASNIGQKCSIIGFSPKARYNLAKELSCLSWPVPPAHITLTYHEVWPKDPKGHLNSLQKWFKYHGFSGVWRLEFQHRKKDSEEQHFVPHYHILACGFTPDDEVKLRDWWAKVSFNTSKYAVKCTYREAGKAAWYLALHTSKGNQAPDLKVGRWWGWIDAKKVKSFRRRFDYGNLTDRQNYRLQRIVRRMCGKKYKPRFGQSYSVFLSEHWQCKLMVYLDSYDERHDPF